MFHFTLMKMGDMREAHVKKICREVKVKQQ